MAYRPRNIEERISHRLKIAKGQLENVMQMVNDDVYCIDILHQLQAVENQLKGTGNLLLENHLKSCVVGAFSKGKNKKAIEEVMNLFKKQE